MSRLGGQFAGILRIEVPAEKESPLMAALRKLEAQGLTIVAHPDQAAPAARRGRLSVLEIVGQDRPGIVRQISQALADHGVNVEELHTGCASAAMSGETLFKATARLSIPDSCTTAELRRDLEKIAEDLTHYLVTNLERFGDPRGADLYVGLSVQRGGEKAGHEYRSGHYVRDGAAPEEPGA